MNDLLPRRPAVGLDWVSGHGGRVTSPPAAFVFVYFVDSPDHPPGICEPFLIPDLKIHAKNFAFEAIPLPPRCMSGVGFALELLRMQWFSYENLNRGEEMIRKSFVFVYIVESPALRSRPCYRGGMEGGSWGGR